MLESDPFLRNIVFELEAFREDTYLITVTIVKDCQIIAREWVEGAKQAVATLER
jgi:hypothetical protein